MDNKSGEQVGFSVRKENADSFDIQSFVREKKGGEGEENCNSSEDNVTEKKETFTTWPFTENVKRDAFGFISRTEPIQPLNVDKSRKSNCDGKDQQDKNSNNGDLRDVLVSKRKSDKKDVKSKKREDSVDKYEDGKRKDKDFEKRKDDRSPHSYHRR